MKLTSSAVIFNILMCVSYISCVILCSMVLYLLSFLLSWRVYGLSTNKLDVDLSILKLLDDIKWSNEVVSNGIIKVPLGWLW